MKAHEALKAILESDGIDDAAKEALKDFDLSSMVTQEQADARAAADRRKAEKKLAEAMERIEAMQEQLDEAQNSGSTELEKAQRELQKLAKAKEAAEAKANEAMEAMNSQARTIALGQVASQINFSDRVSPSVRDLALQEAFRSVDTEDLGNPDLVAPLVRDFIESNEALIVKTNAGGAGSHSGSANGGTTQKITRELIAQKAAANDAKWFRENEAALSEAQSRGEI